MEKLLTESELAEILQQSVLTIRRNRSAAPHRLPPAVKFGGSVRYRRSTVERWLEENEGLEGKKINSSTPSPKIKTTKQSHRGAPTKVERVMKAKNADR